MGGFSHKQVFSEYHCAKCGIIPSIIFKETSLDIKCEEHGSSNIPINEFNNNISFSFECSKCRTSTSNKGIHIFIALIVKNIFVIIVNYLMIKL